MRSKCLWQTGLGLLELGPEGFTPGLDPIELRYYPPFGMGRDEWSIDVALVDRHNPIEKIEVIDFDYSDNHLKLNVTFNMYRTDTKIKLMATHKKTHSQYEIFHGEIHALDCSLHKPMTSGLYHTWKVSDNFKGNLSLFKLPIVKLKVPEDCYLIGDKGHCPIDLTGFHKEQHFVIVIDGVVIGQGGKGGDAGISTVSNGEISIDYPTDGEDGGDAINVEYQTQKVDVLVEGTLLAGKGGKGGESFPINYPDRRFEQIGNPGLGGFPNGHNGRLTDIHYRCKLVDAYQHRSVCLQDNKLVITEPSLSLKGTMKKHDIRSCVPITNDGVDGKLDSLGIAHITIYNESSEYIIDDIVE